jgi:hypothetical protein
MSDSDVEKKAATDYEKVKTLFDYTKFHIGLYTTIGAILVAAIGTKAIPFRPLALWTCIILIGVAGFAGGVVASTLPGCNSLTQFLKDPVGPWDIKLFSCSGQTWTRIEHTAFWLAIIVGLISFASPTYFPPQKCG